MTQALTHSDHGTRGAGPWYVGVQGVVQATLDRVDNPLTRGVGAGALTAGLIAATTAFGPLGAIGTGWWLVCTVAGGTFGLETAKHLHRIWQNTPRARRRSLTQQLDTLGLARERGAITEEERDHQAKELVMAALGVASQAPTSSR